MQKSEHNSAGGMTPVVYCSTDWEEAVRYPQSLQSDCHARLGELICADGTPPLMAVLRCRGALRT